jgi:hypothetical protein
MDNAGGHGTQQARDQYTRQLQHEYNITIIQQSAGLQEVNALDLGIWMSVQSSVEERHKNRHHDPDRLAETVQDAWHNLPDPTITRIFNRIPVVLQQIVSSGGDNITVEERRGHRNISAALAR